jgi:hypothetical protein
MEVEWGLSSQGDSAKEAAAKKEVNAVDEKERGIGPLQFEQVNQREIGRMAIRDAGTKEVNSAQHVVDVVS